MNGTLQAEVLDRLVGDTEPPDDVKETERKARTLHRYEQVLDGVRETLRVEQANVGAVAGQPGDPQLMEQALALLAQALSGPRSERYRVTSNSRPGTFYDLEVVQGDVMCACPGFEYRGACSHARKLKDAIARGARLPAGYAVMEAAS